MSNFNPGLQPTSDPDYERASNVDLFNPMGHNREIDNRNTMAALGVLGQIPKAVDKVFQESTKNELQQGFEKLNGAQGVDLAAGAAVVNPEGSVMHPLAGNQPPTEEQRFIAEGMERYKAAFDQGKISNTQYYAQLEAMVRSVKSRYPGYTDIIDRQIEGIAGVKPANALRQSMLHDIQQKEEAAKSKWDADQRFIEQHSDNLSPADYDKYQKGELTADQAKSKIQERRAQVQELQHKVTELNARATSNKLTEDEAKKGASDLVFTTRKMALDDITPIIEQAEAEVRAGTYDPATYARALVQKRAEYQRNALAAISKGLGNKLDATEANRIIEESGRAFDDAAQAFTKEGVGYLSILKTQIEAQRDKDTVAVLGDPRTSVPLRSLMLAQHLAGPQVAAELATRMDAMAERGNAPGVGTQIGRVLGEGDSSKVDPVVKNLTFENSTAMGLGDVGRGNPLQHIENLVKIGKDTPAALQTALNVWADNITNPKLGEDFAKKSAGILFNDKEFLTKAFKDQESRKVAFGILTSPKVTAAMQRLKGTPEYEAYKDFAYNGFVTIIKGSVNRLQNVAERPYLDLKFDENSGHLSLVPNADGERIAQKHWYDKALPFSAATILEDLLGRGLSDDVRSINAALDNVRPLLEGDKYKTGDQLKNLVHALYNSAPQEKKGLWQWMVKELDSTKIEDRNPDDLMFGGKHPNFTQASGVNGKPRSLTSLFNEEDRSDPHRYYERGMQILENEGGLPRHIAQGFMGNFHVETGGFDARVISGDKKGDGGSAIGLAQWHPDRQAEFRKHFGKDLADSSYEDQVRFVLYELDNVEAGAKRKILKAKTPGEAAALIDKYYERSSGEHRAKRVDQALAYAAKD